MLYQLSNGKVIHLSVEDYLSMTDRELHELANSGYGSDPSHQMFYDKKIKRAKEDDFEEDEDDFEDDEIDLDFVPESYETNTSGPIDLDSLSDE